MATNLNLAQIHTNNPVTSLGNTDLIYVDVGGTTDGAMTGANLIAQLYTGGTVTSVGSGTGLTGGPITGSGSLSLASIATKTLLANATGSTATPTATLLTTLLDATFSNSQGAILYRDASAWMALAPGTSGNFLQTQGASANPQWAAASGGGGPWSSGAGTGSAIGGDGTCTATGTNALSYGVSNCASTGNASKALGSNCHATADYAFASGISCYASAVRSTSLGSFCSTSGYAGVTAGNSNTNAQTVGIVLGGGLTLGSSIGNGGSVMLGSNSNHAYDGCLTFCDSSGTVNNPTAAYQCMITATGGYYFYVGSSLAFSIDVNNNVINSAGVAYQGKYKVSPSTGFSFTIPSQVRTVQLTPSGTLATGTIIMPGFPVDGQEIRVTTSQTVTALTVSPGSGQTVLGAPTTITPSTPFGYEYDSASSTWFRI